MQMSEKQCIAITASGEQCKREATEGDYCKQHAQGAKLVPVKIVVRYISKTSIPEEGSWTLDEVEGYLWSFYDQGYKLKETHYIGENPAGVGIVFVLALDA